MRRYLVNHVYFLVVVILVGLGIPGTGIGVRDASAQGSPVELEYWHFYSGRIGEMHSQLVAEFNELHPHIRVRPVFGGTPWTMRDKLMAALVAQAGPDVASIDQFWISELAVGGHVVPVEDFIAGSTDFD